MATICSFLLSINNANAQKLAMLEPKISGTWKVVETYKEVPVGKLVSYDISHLDWSIASETILPLGVEIAFHGGLDSESNEPISVMEIHGNRNSDLCKHKIFGSSPQHCGEFHGMIKKEFTLGFERDFDSIQQFFPVGAKKGDIVYEVRLDGGDWFCQFYVSRDNKAMWSGVFLQETKDGRGIPGTDSGGFQKWIKLK